MRGTRSKALWTWLCQEMLLGLISLMWKQAQKKLPGQMEPQGFDKIKYVVNTSRRVCRAIGVVVQHLPWEVHGAIPMWRPPTKPGWLLLPGRALGSPVPSFGGDLAVVAAWRNLNRMETLQAWMCTYTRTYLCLARSALATKAFPC